jgi:hypothetical protein
MDWRAVMTIDCSVMQTSDQASLDLLPFIIYLLRCVRLLYPVLQWDPLSLLQDISAHILRALSKRQITIHTLELNVTNCAPMYVEAPPATYGT